MATLARIDELCDTVAAVLKAALPGLSVEAADVPDVNRDAITTRKVYVYPIEYADRGPVSRGQDATAYTIGVLTVEKYTDAGVMTRAWRSERTAWVQENVYRLFGNARDRIEGAHPDTIVVTEDRDEQGERKLFWSEVAVTLVEEN